MATRTAVMNLGKDAGQRTWRKMEKNDAPKERRGMYVSCGIARTASRTAMMTWNTMIRKSIKTLEISPTPASSMRIGSKAIFGTGYIR